MVGVEMRLFLFFLVMATLVASGCANKRSRDVDSGPIVTDGGGTDAGPPMTCSNGRRDGDETATDCGGSCAPCDDGQGCSLPADCQSRVCSGGYCLMPSCMDGVLNGAEIDIDCGGGTCSGCGAGAMCTGNADCASLVCMESVCLESSCTDGIMDSDETDVDCGGSCAPCGSDLRCILDSDCASGICLGDTCTAPICDDRIQNGDETDVDCGGSCPGCADGRMCTVDDDCSGSACAAGMCISCMDGRQNGDETDRDCGGPDCDPCADTLMCAVDTDCAGMRCVTGMCVSCMDMTRNAEETDVDCGGGLCPGCADGRMCVVPGDCMSSVCTGGVCQVPTCTDGVTNGTESDVDCGGTCTPCATGSMCNLGSDCAEGVCGTGGTCSAPTCTDGVTNGTETDIDCGGPGACPRCADFRRCTAPSDCTTAMCTMGFCGMLGCMPFGTVGGYTGCSRTVPVASLPCPDIRPTGTLILVPDHSATNVTMPFPFTFFGSARTTARVGPGAISFTGVTPSTTNSCSTSTSGGALIAALWDHLHTDDAPGTVYHHTTGTAPNRTFHVQWNSRIFGASSTDLLDVRVMIHETSNDIDVCYVDTTVGSTTYNQGRSATAGIKDGTTTGHLQFSCNTATLTDGLWLQYLAP
jgi:hypothetical protein